MIGAFVRVSILGFVRHFSAEYHRFQGIAEVENEEHCDFKILRDMLIRTHMQVQSDNNLRNSLFCIFIHF